MIAEISSQTRLSSNGSWLGDAVHDVDEKLIEPLKRLETAAAAEVRLLENRIAEIEHKMLQSLEVLERRVRQLGILVALLTVAHVVQYLESWVRFVVWLATASGLSRLFSSVSPANILEKRKSNVVVR